jgi:hypothetical protein
MQIEISSVIPSGVGIKREKKWFVCDDASFQRYTAIRDQGSVNLNDYLHFENKINHIP